MDNKEEMKKLNMAIRQAESAGLPIIGLCKRQIEILESAHNEFMEQAQQKGYNIDTSLDILEVEIKQFSAMKQIAQKAGLPVEKYDKRIRDARVRVLGEETVKAYFD